MAKIEVDTITENCWNNCDDFEIISTKFIGDGMTYHRIFQCENVNKCRRIQQVIENEIKGGEDELDSIRARSGAERMNCQRCGGWDSMRLRQNTITFFACAI